MGVFQLSFFLLMSKNQPVLLTPSYGTHGGAAGCPANVLLPSLRPLPFGTAPRAQQIFPSLRKTPQGYIIFPSCKQQSVHEEHSGLMWETIIKCSPTAAWEEAWLHLILRRIFGFAVKGCTDTWRCGSVLQGLLLTALQLPWSHYETFKCDFQEQHILRTEMGTGDARMRLLHRSQGPTQGQQPTISPWPTTPKACFQNSAA